VKSWVRVRDVAVVKGCTEIMMMIMMMMKEV